MRYVLAALLLAPLTASADEVDFSRDVLPILSGHCFQCHGPDGEAREAELRLDLPEGAFGEREGGPVVVPGKPQQSKLYLRVSSDDEGERMPPAEVKLDLTDEQIATLGKWIAAGAPWRRHWAFEPITRPPPPEVASSGDSDWPRNAVDRFILARLNEQQLRPSPEAAKTRLLRRVTLDLTGLPPTIDEIDAFLADHSPTAYERVVDRLLASPEYGQRMAWDWLDAARYADTDGFQNDPEREMWPWRDWAVRSLNRGVPFDQFTIEQLAGDLLPTATREQKLATGFNRNHMFNGEGGRIAEETRVENVFDRTETTATVWLGLTMTCCRCHDHKFDPLTQREYYQFADFFNQTSETGSPSGRNGKIPPIIQYPTPEEKLQSSKLESVAARAAEAVAATERELRSKAESGELDAAANAADLLAAMETPIADRNNAALQAAAKLWESTAPDYAQKLNALVAAREKLAKDAKASLRVMVMDQLDKPRETFILHRGAYNKRGEKVEPGFPAMLPAPAEMKSPDRLDLARWLVDPQHPLTPRVVVNRHWRRFFGGGLVKTIEDFGKQGARPTHPELLDWLARDFVDSGWDVKRLHRQIVTSATYRQSSKTTAGQWERDPQNQWLARGPRHRLPSWMLRDQALAASGLLVRDIGGRPVRPYQPAGVWAEATFGKKRYTQDHGESLYRRSLYTFWRRIVGPTMFFDSAKRQTCEVKPSLTNTPLHALTTLNETTFVEAARALAGRIIREGGESPADRIALAYRLLVSRPPDAQELAILQARLKTLRDHYAANPKEADALLAVGESPRDAGLDSTEHAAYAVLCSLILNLDETLSKE